jgi:hypothetical protein
MGAARHASVRDREGRGRQGDRLALLVRSSGTAYHGGRGSPPADMCSRLLGPSVNSDPAPVRPGAVPAGVGEWLAPLVPLAMALAVWAPLRENYFIGDDFFHLYDAVTRDLPSLLGQFWGGHFIGTFNVVTLAFFRLFGPAPRPYFSGVLIVHLINTALLYRAIHRFTARVALACFGATLWATCPVLEGTLGYYSVFGQVLLTAIVLWILCDLGRLLRSGAALTPALAARWGLLLAVGTGCFGMALGVTAAFPVAVAIALPRAQLPTRSVLVLFLGAAAILAAYRVAFMVSSAVPPAERQVFAGAPLLHAMPAVLALAWHLVGFGAAVLVSDLLGVHQTYPDWAHAAGAVGLVLFVLAAVVAGDGVARRRILALAMVAAGAYGAVAAGRGLLFVILQMSPAVAARSARYQYLPLSLVTLLTCVALSVLAARGRIGQRTITAVGVLWILARLGALVIRPLAIAHADPERVEVAAMLESVREQVARTAPGEMAVIESHPFSINRATPELMPGWAGLFVVYFRENAVDGRAVRFLVSEDDWRRAQDRGGRIAELVVARH